ncbi:MAG TPA: L,D-transpeptidase [Polyangiaceae bacterium]|nr:L,D-transpeptidase [Polyangiaceae bacterium]
MPPRILPRASLALLVGCALAGCEREPAPQPTPPPSRASQATAPEPTADTPPPAPAQTAEVEAPEPEPVPTTWSVIPTFPPDYSGAWFAVTTHSAGVYEEPSMASTKLGYVRMGGRVPVEATPVSQEGCEQGWYALRSGGFICGNFGTTNLEHPEVKFGVSMPKLDDVLPYAYARNAKHGTPLYHTVPSRKQMEKYEPYLVKKKEPPKKEPAYLPASDTVSASLPPNPSLPLAGDLLAASATVEPEVPWWQQENIKERLHEVKLAELEAEADGVLAKRLVTGFYVAVDHEFSWNDRTWFKTTKGFVAPSDRFWKTEGSKFRGVELDGEHWKLPIAWVYGGRKNSVLYEIDPEKKTVKRAGTVERFVALPLTGRSVVIGQHGYEELRDGTWIRQAHVRVTRPGPLPKDLAPNERWIDVNLATQTVVAFVGETPVYATLISSGRESKIKEKDHRTPVGEWRIGVKHVTTTMDGDGTAAGDLPYSIEDVPYAMYYYKAYALHGAFWHDNYGTQRSHGCVNLSPLDSKYLFFFADPPVPPGFHGAWATVERPGSRVVVHE